MSSDEETNGPTTSQNSAPPSLEKMSASPADDNDLDHVNLKQQPN